MSYELGRRGRLDLFTISADRTGAKDIAKILRKAGFEVTARNITNDLQEYAAQIVEQLAVEAEISAQVECPQDTGELATQHIHTDVSDDGLEATVYVDDLAHLGRRNDPEEASSLADLLNAGGTGVGKYIEDKDWIKRAFDDFKSTSYAGLKKNKVLKRIFKRKK